MSDATSKRFGIPGPRSSSSNNSMNTGFSFAKTRARPVMQRISSSTTPVNDGEMGRVSLDSMAGTSIDGVMTATTTMPNGPQTPQRIKLHRSFTSPMQFESSDIEYSSSSSSIERRRLARYNGNQTSHEEIEEEDDTSQQGNTQPLSEEYVVALHDFTSSNSTCLSFGAGQVIRVFNRDQSGWWDGELNGERGWFPSNYVDEDGITSTAEAQSVGNVSRSNVDPIQSFEQSSNNNRPPTSSSVSSEQRNRAAAINHTARSNDSPQISSRGASLRSPTPKANTYRHHNQHHSSIMDPIHHAISLLHNAVRANRVAHFQPSTACVISSVRSVLSATDCLTRESVVLKAHPILAKERKQILAELSKLVSQARNASSPMVEEYLRDHEMDVMLSLADLVLRNVQSFLEVAIECGVTVPDRRSSVYDDLYEDRRAAPINSSIFYPPLDRNDQDKTPTPDSPRTSLYRSAAFPTNSKSSNAHGFYSPSLVTSPQQTLQYNKPATRVSILERGRSDSLQSEMQEASSSGDHSFAGSGSRSYSGSATRSDYGYGTSPSGSCASLPDITSSSLRCTPAQVLDRLQTANDHLLSVIAAYIGHVHSHSRDSHASSYAFLIDMTRATVDGVRSLLVIVEAVHNDGILRAELPGQMGILWDTRESVYEATAALVTAARIITSTTTQSDGTIVNVYANEEDEKTKLLQTATTVLRTGGECVGAVKMCLNRARSDMIIVVPLLATTLQSQSRRPSATTSATQSSIEVDEEENLMSIEEVEISQKSRLRGKQTLSLLGRKATSLSCLREKYEHDDKVQQGRVMPLMEEETEQERGEDMEEMRGTIRSKRPGRYTKGDGIRRYAEASGDSSDSSGEPMSRQHSRASGSTLQSIRSESTAETSARPSFDRAESSKGLLDEQYRLHRGSGSHESGKLIHIDRHQSQQQSPVSSMFPISSGASTYAPDHEEADICFNSEGQLTGATLSVLVERMTPHNTTIDASFSNTFFLCFRLFTTPMELFEALETRYKLRAPVDIKMDSEECTKWMETKAAPVRLRVFNFLKIWLETHWNESSDYVILEKLIQFTQTSMTHTLNRPAQRLAEIAQKRLTAAMASRGPRMTGKDSVSAASNGGRPTGSLMRMMSTDRLKMAGSNAITQDVSQMYATSINAKGSGGPLLPPPIISKSLLSTLRNNVINGTSAKISILEFDLLELARQLTIMESKIYCCIMPQELLGQEFSKKAGVSNAINVKKMSALSNSITGWISECILNEVDAKKRTSLVKYFIKLGDRCLTLNNFNTLMAIQCALNSSTIARLKRTWDGLPTKHRQMMEYQRQCIEHTRNFASYRQTLRETMAPALPFVGLFLTDLTFCHEGNASTRPSPVDPKKKLLNFDKYVKMSRIIGELQRFQVAYHLVEVPEIQVYLQSTLEEVQSAKGAETADDLYRRSLLLEPRRTGSHNDAIPHPSPATISVGMTKGNGSGGDSKLGLDLFNWK